MSSTAERLLRLIALLQGGRHWSGSELAERMGVDRRSIRRDIGRLRALGYAVQASAGVGGGYQLAAGAPTMPLLLDEEEATAVALALRAAAASVAGIEDTARTVLGKLDPLVPSRQRRRAGELHAATATVGQSPASDARHLGVLARACREVATLQFQYCSHHGVVSERVVEAQHLVNHGHRWYLLAWDLGREDWRTLRVERIQQVRWLAGNGLRRATPGPPEWMVQRAVSQSPFALQAELRLAGTLSELTPRVPSWCGVLQVDGDQHCRIRMGADTPAMLAGQILSVGVPVVAIRAWPATLREALLACVTGLATVLSADAVAPSAAAPAPPRAAVEGGDDADPAKAALGSA